jgi:quercetin dioxygenase-like cupin family protein
MTKPKLVTLWGGTLALAFLLGYAVSDGRIGLLHAQPASTTQAPLAGALPPGMYSKIELAPSGLENLMAWSGADMAKAHEALVARAAAGTRSDRGDPDFFKPFVTRTHSYIMVHRVAVPAGQPPRAEQHEGATDVYIMVGGSGELIVGGDVQNKQAGRPGEYGGVLVGGRHIPVKAGDIVNIPPNTPHASVPATGGMTYVLMKVNVGLYPWSLINGTP